MSSRRMILELSKLPKSLEPIEVKLNECLGLGKKIAKKKEVEFFHVKTQNQVLNIFTKSLKFEDIRRLKARLGVQKN